MHEFLGNPNQTAYGRRRIKNAFTPVIWFVVTVSSVMLTAIALSAPIWVQAIAFFMWVCCVGLGLFAFLWFLFTDPDRLQSEDYQIQKSVLQLTQGRGQPPVIDNAPLTSNPLSQQKGNGE